MQMRKKRWKIMIDDIFILGCGIKIQKFLKDFCV